ncbi:MAG: UvrD-helicase domain-containing protein [Alphaproteobacteria bacterium]
MSDRKTIGAMATASQQKASNPKDCVWVEASAGTGKTKILSDRVLRLLLNGVNPSKILALTYTKAAAVEMSERIYKRLADWVALSDEVLEQELVSLLGYNVKDNDIINARRLFVSILDAPVNMRIQTIHAFCQEILKRFAFEANVSPYFDVVDEVKAREIVAQIKTKILNDNSLFDSIAYLSENTSEDGFSDILKTIVDNRSKLSLNNKIKDLNVNLNPVLSIDIGDENYDDFKLKYLTKTGDVRKKLSEEDLLIAEEILKYEEENITLSLYKSSKAVFEIASRFLSEYELFKKENSLMDYEDLIFYTNQLLKDSAVADWVLYKLDGGIDHILIDEAQDTSFNQWQIILSITEEFFASENNKTIFVVGDRKQSIYSFQGADVKNFDYIKKYFFAKKDDFKQVDLNVSFRSTAPILENVNNVFKSQKLDQTPFRVGDCGEVYLWDLIVGEKKEKKEWSFSNSRTTKESPSQKLAKKIALKIKTMVEEKQILQSKNRPIKYQDFLILVRRRGVFVDELIRELKASDVNVLGADRLKLLEQIAVQDLLALAKFLLLPSDDLNLACVLKSPIFGLNDDDLFDLCHKRKNTLFNAIRDNKTYNDTYKILNQLLNMADYVRPFELFSFVLNNLNAKKNFISRLGLESIDAIEEFLNLTINFERDNIVSLQNFVEWIERDDIEIKRQLESGVDAVRIMTAHGSKGLQAPIVIMPDTTKVPKSKKDAKLLLDDGMLYPLSGAFYQNDATEIVEKLNEEEFYEYQRLLYVALTRAEDILIVCGFATSDKIDENSWYASVKHSLEEIGSKTDEGLVFKNTQTFEVKAKAEDKKEEFELGKIDFLYNKAPEIEFDAKPYAPSKMGDDDEEEYELYPDNGKFAKGLAIHKILQYMNSFDKDKIDGFLKAYNLHPKLKVDVLKLFENNEIKALFEGDSRAEVSVCGKVEDKIINGVIDRLVVRDDEVLIVDYKTDKNTGEIPTKYKNQLNAYKSLVSQIYAGRVVKAFVLWTATGELVEV